jgi:hypothetical protein
VIPVVPLVLTVFGATSDLECRKSYCRLCFAAISRASLPDAATISALHPAQCPGMNSSQLCAQPLIASAHLRTLVLYL